MKRALCIYHSVDADGVFSALIINHWHYMMEGPKSPEMVLVGWTYGDRVPEQINEEFDTVFLVDIVLPGPVMKSLVSKTQVIWIDHHIGNIELSKKFGFENVGGIRKVGVALPAGCVD